MQKFSRSLAVHTFRPHRSKIWTRFSRSYFRTNFRPVENVPCVNKAWDTNNEKQEYKGGFLVKHNSVYLLVFQSGFQCRSRVMCPRGIYLNFFLFSKGLIPTAYFAAWTFMIVIMEVGIVILLAFTSVPATTCRREDTEAFYWKYNPTQGCFLRGQLIRLIKHLALIIRDKIRRA